jgi:tryptophan synthase alpha chain
MMLESYIRNRLEEKDILLMTHIVMGYPSFDDSLRIIQIMVDAGVDLMELQIPFAEPTSDGPVIVRANQEALKGGVTLKDCFKFIEQVTRTFDIPFLIMSYYTIPFRFGLKRFVNTMSNCGLRGAIIPDLPREEGRVYLDAMVDRDLAPILIFSPATSLERMGYIASAARGFIYCVARKGVTGENTDFAGKLTTFLTRCRQGTTLPLALGFGVKEKAHIDFLKGKADIAVIGSQTIRVMEQKGIAAVGDFIRSLGVI